MKPVTPIESYPDLAAAVGVSRLLFKREDMHPYGSHKGRSIPVMIDHYARKGERRFALSSSGNAALAAAMYVRKLNSRHFSQLKRHGSKIIQDSTSNQLIELDIFVGHHIAPHKLGKLKDIAAATAASPESGSHIRVLVKERPLQALTQAVNDGVRSLRQSTDDTALEGYKSLAEELATDAKLISKGAAIFIGTSSGTTAQALAAYFSEKKLPIQIHIVQTSSCHAIADGFEPYDGSDERSTADAIVDTMAIRKSVLVPLIKKTGGHGWIVSNDDIQAAEEMALKYAGLSLSPNGALPVAGAMKAAASGFDLPPTIVCVIGGE